MSVKEILEAYVMTEEDEELIDLAKKIIYTFSGSYKPHIIPNNRLVSPPYYKWIHSPEGYFLISSETEDFREFKVVAEETDLCSFIERVFLALTGDSWVTAGKVFESEEVNRMLEKEKQKKDIRSGGDERTCTGTRFRYKQQVRTPYKPR